jgi:hypothetical protein
MLPLLAGFVAAAVAIVAGGVVIFAAGLAAVALLAGVAFLAADRCRLFACVLLAIGGAIVLMLLGVV